jgi:nicotinamide-nucleotide amidase
VSAGEVLDVLRERGETLVSAESLTGGRVAAAITGVPGASAVFLGGVVSYATGVKRDLLGVDGDLIAVHGVISAECASAMATGVRDLMHADWALSTTGVAGPDRQEDQPVGTVYVGCAGPGVVETRLVRLSGDRARIQEAAVGAALELLQAMLQREDPPLG